MGTQPDINDQRPQKLQPEPGDMEALLEQIWALAAEIRAGLPDDVTSDHEWLYDEETGLPRSV